MRPKRPLRYGATHPVSRRSSRFADLTTRLWTASRSKSGAPKYNVLVATQHPTLGLRGSLQGPIQMLIRPWEMELWQHARAEFKMRDKDDLVEVYRFGY